jgi:hypothetical protein
MSSHLIKVIQRAGAALFAACLAAAAMHPAMAQQAEVKSSLSATDSGTIYFMSANAHTGYREIYKKQVIIDTVIRSELRMPENMKPGQKVPAMVVMHSSSGVTQDVIDWCKYLNSMGIATLMVDSFVTRGITRTTEDQKLLAFGTSAVDALLGLKLLPTSTATVLA